MRHSNEGKAGEGNEKGGIGTEVEDDYLIYEFEGWTFARLAAERKSRVHFLLGGPYRYVTVILLPARRQEKGEMESPMPSYEEVLSLRGSSTARTVFRGRRLICLDSPCYHAGGPLGEGDIVELEDLAGRDATPSCGRRQRSASHDKKGGELRGREPGHCILCIRCPWHRWLVSLETGEEVLLYPPDALEEGKEPEKMKREGSAKRSSSSSSSHQTSSHSPTYVIKEMKSGGIDGGLSSSRATPPNNFIDGEKASVKIGKRVQRLHYVEIDDEAKILRIMIERSAGTMPNEDSRRGSREKSRKSVLRSDELAMSLKNGARCMEIQDIKSRGLDIL